MLIDQTCVRQGFLAAMLAPGVIGSQLKLWPETLVQDVECRNDAVEDMHPNAVAPHCIETLIQSSFAHDLSTGHRLVEIACDGVSLREVAAGRELKGRRLTPRVHLQMRPLA